MITTGGEGKVPPRKRVRGKIGNPRNAPEIKMHNLWNNVTDTAQSYYSNRNIIGVFTQEDRNSVWWPLQTYWPTVGNTQFNRIGRKIRVKFLRLKGFVYYSPYLITQVRYRIVLYRCKTAQTFNHSVWLQSLYACFNPLTDANSVDDMEGRCVFNYYMSWFDNDKLRELDCKRRVLYKGLIKPQADIGNYNNNSMQMNSTVGSETSIISSDTYGKVFGPMATNSAQANGYFNGATAATVNPNISTETSTLVNDLPIKTTIPQITWFGKFQQHYSSGNPSAYDAVTPGNQRGFFPIDVTVDMNDNIDCEEYSYVFVVESDWCIGQDAAGSFGYVKARTNFGLTFTPQIFYTDD